MKTACKKSKSGKHLFFSMTGHCFYCGKHNPSENLFQRKIKGLKIKKPLYPGKLGVFKIGRVSIYSGCWEVRGKNEKESKWLPFTRREDAVEFLKRRK